MKKNNDRLKKILLFSGDVIRAGNFVFWIIALFFLVIYLCVEMSSTDDCMKLCLDKGRDVEVCRNSVCD